MKRFNFKYWPFMILLSIISACVGGLFANAGQPLHEPVNEIFATTGNSYPPMFGNLLGVVFGFLIGLSYAIIMVKYCNDYMDGWVVNIGIRLGVMAGMICAFLVHGCLMLIYQSTHIAPMIIGIICGAIAGLILGCVSCGLFYLYKMVVERADSGEINE